nr:retrovirus-related Pol polyprotein from transposon TNT 1-94 [Tanacetum cinerariifolium]
MDQDSVHMVAASKVPMLELNVETTIAPETAKEKVQRRLELKARKTLLTGIPNEHHLKFNSIKDAKSFLQAVEKRFGGNAATKKTQMNLLKQQYVNFTASSLEVLDQTFDRLQKLISQLEIHGESISKEDVNQKFLRSLSPEWNTHTIVWRNKPRIDTLSLDDLYNNLKISEPEVKWTSSLNINTQNVAFMSSNTTSNTNGGVNTAHGVTTASTQATADLQQIHPGDLEEIDLRWQMAMLTMRAWRFLKNIRRMFSMNGNETIGFDKSKVECYNCHKRGHFARECRAPRSQDIKHKESTRRTVPIETHISSELVSCDGIRGYDWSDQAKMVQLTLHLWLTLLQVLTLRNFLPTKPDFFGLEEFMNEPIVSEPTVKKPVVETSEAKASIAMPKIMKKLMDDMLPLEVTPKDGKSQAEGKQQRASCKSKTENSISLPLHLLHMDLFGPTFIKSLMKKMYCLVVTDDYSRFTWVFFLVSKDETSAILKTFIIEIENLVDHKKVIRCDNETEFKNREMNQFCEMKCIIRQYSIAKTPQQNRVAERRNKTLIEADRTMLADLKLSTTFWAEVVNTDCYVQNKVLIVKPQNKTPYELFHGRTPALSFMRLFGCHVTILNTKYHLGKFDGKANEGFFFRYSLNSKAFRVTRIVEENLHIRFNENTPNIARSRPNSIFDIDALTKSMNCKPTIAENQSNGNAGKKARDDIESKSSQDDGFQPLSDDGKKVNEDARQESECKDQEKEENMNITNNVNATDTNEVNVVAVNTNNKLPFDLKMLALEDISTFNFSSDHQDGNEEADMNNMGTTIHIYQMEKELSALNGSSRTRRMKEVFDKNKARFVAQGHTQEEGIDYDEVFASVARIVAIRLFLAYASFKDFVVYQMNVKSAMERLKKRSQECKHAYETQKPMFKDEDGEEVDLHMYRSMIGSLMYLTSSRPDIMFVVCACARYQVNPKFLHLYVVKRIFSDYARASLDRSLQQEVVNFLGITYYCWVDVNAVEDYTSCIEQFWATFKAKTVNEEGQLQALVDGKKLTLMSMVKNLDNVNKFLIYPRNIKRVGKGFSGRDTPLFPTMMVQAQEEIGEGYANPTNPHHTPTIIQPSTSQPQKKQKSRKTKRKDTELPQTSVPTSVVDEAVNEEMNNSLERATTTDTSLDAEQDRGNISKTQSKATPNELGS